jgi:hypothetical protein
VAVSRRLLLSAAITLTAYAFAPGIAREYRGNLVLPTPPPVLDGRAYVPARDFCEWLGARIEWNADTLSVTITWNDGQCSWSVGSPSLLLRGGRASVAIRDFADAFGGAVRYRSDETRKVVDFWGPGGTPYAAIPVGWAHPRPPSDLSPPESEVWHFLAPPQTQMRAVRDSIWEPQDIKVVERWASAKLVPLNVVSDDARVVLGKRDNEWRILAGPGTDIGSEGPVGGIPATVWQKLGMPSWP